MASLALVQMDALSPCMDFYPSANSPNYRKQGHTVCLTVSRSSFNISLMFILEFLSEITIIPSFICFIH